MDPFQVDATSLERKCLLSLCFAPVTRRLPFRSVHPIINRFPFIRSIWRENFHYIYSESGKFDARFFDISFFWKRKLETYGMEQMSRWIIRVKRNILFDTGSEKMLTILKWNISYTINFRIVSVLKQYTHFSLILMPILLKYLYNFLCK